MSGLENVISKPHMTYYGGHASICQCISGTTRTEHSLKAMLSDRFRAHRDSERTLCLRNALVVVADLTTDIGVHDLAHSVNRVGTFQGPHELGHDTLGAHVVSLYGT